LAPPGQPAMDASGTTMLGRTLTVKLIRASWPTDIMYDNSTGFRSCAAASASLPPGLLHARKRQFAEHISPRRLLLLLLLPELL
jgi:hypothetical protein